jgi:tetratricopeptide (TPR) repeat protein
MTKISLRVYNREIEAMVEGGQVDEAIAHCQFILKTFPMHLETYRLLGKAFLETRRYADAADIFQRILMSVPDDFVSHVGMSIIRDDESKLDEAIWHMERAFEVQPSNPAIQDELRKLYGRRDGVQPPKVRLTRDALANMYTQGALYSQAIAEIRAVLADDPNRPDLQVMLARAYSKDGRKNQAIETCTDLLKKYPYCFDALRILLDLMPSTDQHEITETYRLRIRALDPYAGFVTGSIFNSDKVADAAVNLELLDYDPNKLESESQPAWASSLGIKLEPDNTQQSEPDWLSEKTTEEQPVSEVDSSLPVMDEEEQTSSESEDVPAWMRSSEWEKSTDLTSENPVFDETESESDGPIARADIPEWLKDMAPKEEMPEAGQAPGGFDATLDEATISSVQGDIHFDTNEESGFVDDNKANVVSEEEILDWLKDMGNDEPTQAETPVASQTMDADQDVFGELSSEQPLETSEKPYEQPVDDISAWLGESQQDSMEGSSEKIEKADEEDLPGWLKDIEPDRQNAEIEPESEPVMEFLNQSDDVSSTRYQYESVLETNSEEELPDWLKEVGLNQEEPLANDEITTTLAVGTAIISAEDDQKSAPELEPESDGSGLEEVMQTPTSEETSMNVEPIEAGMHSLDDQDAAMAWLESLAARQGAKSEELLTKPEDRLDEPPEWVRNTVEEVSTPTEDEALISHPVETNFIESVNSEDTSAMLEGEFAAAKLPGDDSLQALDADSQDELVEGEVFASTGLGVISEEFVQAEEQEQPFDTTTPIQDVQTVGLVDEFSAEGGQEAEQTLHLDHTDSTEPELAATLDADVSEWLKEMDAHDATIEEKPAMPKVAEFYGNDVPEPLPDWLQDMEKESTSSEWISESEGLPEMKKDAGRFELVSDEKDFDDIGEIFPTDTTDWAFEDKEPEPGLEPLGDSFKPVAPGEWQPLHAEEQALEADLTEISKTKLFPASTESFQVSKLPGTGMLSKIPAKDIEKESETLERAQTFIESGDLKNAIDEYGRLIKKGQLLEGVIHDLRETTYRYPIDIGVWQLLGDAYMRANRLQDALDAYTKAEELLR